MPCCYANASAEADHDKKRDVDGGLDGRLAAGGGGGAVLNGQQPG